MKRRNLVLLALIVVLALIAVYIDLPNSPGLHIGSLDRGFEIRQGLDLQGGLQVLLEADLPPDQKIEPESLEVAATIIGNRVNGLGVVEPLVQTQGDRRIIVELPGVEDAEQAIATLKETGLLEFIDAGDLALPPGTVVQTTFPLLESQGATTQFLGSEATGGGTGTEAEPTTTPLEIESPSLELTPSETTEMLTSAVSTEPVTPSETTPGPALPDWIFATILTGAHLKTAWVDRNPQTGELEIAFELTDVGGPIFAEFTGRNIGKYASIVLDKEVISSPVIQSQISDGRGVIQGNFELEEAQRLVVQLRYGALPIPLRVETTRSVGPTLGQDSVQRSIQAGAVGLTIVLIFMLVYYRLPGFLANLALILYGLLNFAVYKAGWPVLLVISVLMIVSYLSIGGMSGRCCWAGSCCLRRRAWLLLISQG
jgi:preprotein translocase subunit SecD